MPARKAHGIVRLVAVENQPSRSSVAGAAPPVRATAAAAKVAATASTERRIGLIVRRPMEGAVLMRKVNATATAMSAPAVSDHEATASASSTVAPAPRILTGLCGHSLSQPADGMNSGRRSAVARRAPQTSTAPSAVVMTTPRATRSGSRPSGKDSRM